MAAAPATPFQASTTRPVLLAPRSTSSVEGRSLLACFRIRRTISSPGLKIRRRSFRTMRCPTWQSARRTPPILPHIYIRFGRSMEKQTGAHPNSGELPPAGIVTRADLKAGIALAKRFVGAWTATHSAMVLSVGSWSLLWAQALYGPPVVPQTVTAVGFFCGLALAGVDQRLKRNGT